MHCANTNQDGILDYMELMERFHIPAKNIGKDDFASYSQHMCIPSVQYRVQFVRADNRLVTTCPL